MIIGFKNKYSVYATVEKTIDTSLDLDLEDFFRNHLNGQKARNKQDLLTKLKEYISWNGNLVYGENDEICDECIEIQFYNEDNIVSSLQEYIKKPNPCCILAPHDANFCSTCGEKLK